MGNYIKGALKILGGYCISLIIFGVFLYPVLSIARDKFSFWLPIYSFVIFLMMFAIIYSDIRKLAVKEKRPQYGLNPYPLKGFVLGLTGMVPIILLELVYLALNFSDPTLLRLKHVALNTVLGPLYGFIKLGGSSAAAYVIATLIVPAVAMLGYLAGFYGFELRKKSKKPVKMPQSK